MDSKGVFLSQTRARKRFERQRREKYSPYVTVVLLMDGGFFLDENEVKYDLIRIIFKYTRFKSLRISVHKLFSTYDYK